MLHCCPPPPPQLLELRKGYDEARERVMGSSQMILRGAAERRAFFVKQTGVGANALEPIDEGEVHRLSRDSIRRRYSNCDARRIGYSSI